MLEEGFCAEVKVGGEHLRYNVSAKNWIAPPSESVDDIEHGKERAEAHAKAYLKKAANLELPLLEWKRSRSA